MRMRLRWLFHPLIALPLLASCALVDRDATLEYSAPPREAAAPLAEHAPRVAVVVRDVVDRRKEAEHVGEVRNGFGMHTADVHTKGDPAAWLRHAVRTELQRAGYDVVEPQQRADLVIDAHLQTAHCTAYMSYEGEVCIAVKALSHGRAVVDGVYTGKGGAGVNWTATDESFGETLDLALQDALVQFAHDLRKANGEAVSSRAP